MLKPKRRLVEMDTSFGWPLAMHVVSSIDFCFLHYDLCITTTFNATWILFSFLAKKKELPSFILGKPILRQITSKGREFFAGFWMSCSECACKDQLSVARKRNFD